MECVKQRQETGQKPKCENWFSIIGGLKRRPFWIFEFTLCVQKNWMISQPSGMAILRQCSVTALLELCGLVAVWWHYLAQGCCTVQGSQIFRFCVWGLLFSLGIEEKWESNVWGFITFWLLNHTNVFNCFSTIIWVPDLFLLSAYCF